MSTIISLFLLLSFLWVPQHVQSEPPADGISLYTPYTSRSVTPGQSVTYGVEIINSTSSIQNVSFSVVSLPDSWNPSFTSGTNAIQQIAVKPNSLDSENSNRTINFNLNVPLRIPKGGYRYQLIAKTDGGLSYELPLVVRVTEQGILQTELQVDQANMEGYANSNFNYSFTLNNQTAQEQNYALTSNAPPGWDVRFKSGANYVTSVTVASSENQNIVVEATPSERATADTTEIAIQARSGNTSDQATLEAVIKGRYGLKLSTPSGRLSTEVTAGGNQTLDLVVHNTGTVPLRDIELNASAPTGWNVEFENNSVLMLEPGGTKTVNATIKASSKAIAGDYRMEFTAETPDASSSADLRVTVNQTVTWGSIGVLIILLVTGGITYLFKVYGRR